MPKLRCLINVPDKYTNAQYKKGECYEFADERAKEILAARTGVTNEPYFELVEEKKEVTEITEEIVQAVVIGLVEEAKENNKTIEEVVNEILNEVEETKVEKDVENVDNPMELQKSELQDVVLEDMKVPELKELAEKMKIEGYEKMKKAELIEAVKNN